MDDDDTLNSLPPSGPEMPPPDHELEHELVIAFERYRAGHFDPLDAPECRSLFARVNERGWPEPRSFGPPPGLPFPSEYLPKEAREIADALTAYHRVLPGLAHVMTLGVMSFGASRLCRAVADDHSEILALWVLAISASGDRKSAIQNMLLRASMELLQKAAARWEAAAAEREEQLQTLRKERAEKPDDKGIAEKIAKLIAARQGLGAILDDITPEMLVTTASCQGGWAAVATDEGSSLEVVTGRRHSKNGRTSLAPLIKGYDGSRYAGGRKSDRVRDSEGRVISDGITASPRLIVPLLCGMQPSVFLEYLGDEAMVTQGLLPRAIVCLGGEDFRTVAEPPIPSNVITAWNKFVTDVMNQQPPRDVNGFIEPRELRANAAAVAMLRSYANALRVKREREEVAGAQALAEKRSHGKALRIAGVLAVHTKPDVQVIDERHMFAAIEISKWCDHEFARATGTPTDAPARALATLIRDREIEDRATLDGIRTRNRKGLGNRKEVVRAAAETCARHGLLRIVNVSETKTKPSWAILINPRWRDRWGTGGAW